MLNKAGVLTLALFLGLGGSSHAVVITQQKFEKHILAENASEDLIPRILNRIVSQGALEEYTLLREPDNDEP